MISKRLITAIDKWLDDNVGEQYHFDGAIGQDWARIAKIAEELGETISELILATGQNPRKGIDYTAHERMRNELADVVITAWLALQHFTKDADVTEQIIEDKLEFIYKRMMGNG